MLNNKRCLLELHGCKYIIHNQSWTDVSREIDLSLDHVDYIISDFSSFPNFRQVRSPKKFSEIILERKLREEGEIIGESKIMVHYKDEVSPQNTDIFYTPVPLAHYTQHNKKTSQVRQLQLSFCFHRLLHLALRERAETETACAVIFAYHNSIEILVGNKTHITGFEILESYASGEIISSANDVDVNNIKKTLEFIQRSTNTRIRKIYGYTWLMGVNAHSWVKDLGREMDIPAIEEQAQEIELDGKSYLSSIAPLFDSLKVGDSISETPEKFSYNLYYKIPVFTLLLLLLNAGVLLHYFDLKAQWQEVSATLHGVRQDNNHLNGNHIQEIDYQPALKLALELESAKAKPSYARLLSELIDAVKSQNIMSFDLLKLNYVNPEAPDKNMPINIELKGNVHQGFANGVIIVNAFVADLRTKGYTLLDSKITPNVAMTSFHILLER